MALTLTTSGSLNTTVDNYAFSILSNTSSVQLGAVSLKLVVPGGCTIKNVNAGTSSVDSLVFLQQDGNLNIGMYTLSNWVVNTNDVILSITASGMSTGSFTLNTDEDWYCEIASSSAEPFTDFAIKMPSLASPYASVSTTLEAVSILSGVNPSITAVGAPNSSVFGSGSRTSGTASIAEGINTLASGLASHAAGINTTASGQAAFSMGIETDADGMASFAAGSGSWARGTATVAFGIGTIASSSGQLAVGHYNEAKTDINNIFVVGDGTSNSLRRNVIEVYGGQGASLRGVKIDTVSPSGPATTTIDGFNVYGRTIFYGGVTQSANIITIDGDYGGITHGSASYIAETYTSLGQLRGRTLFNYKGIDFNNSVQTTAPSSTHLWTNSSNRLFYSSSAVILNGGNTLGSTMLIGTNDTNNLELETNNTTRIFISSSGNVGIGTSSPTERLHVQGNSLFSGSIKFDPTQDPDLAGLDTDSTILFQSSSNTLLGYDLYFRQNGNLVKWKWFEGILETGLLYGGIVTYSGSNVFVSPGSGIIVNHNVTATSEVGPIVDYVTWGPITQSITNISSSQVTYIYIDENGALQQQSTRFTSQQFHDDIPLGAVAHFNYSSISAFGGAVQTAYNQTAQIVNFIDAFGPLKLSGYGLTGQPSSLRLSVGSGTSYIHGGFYDTNLQFPSQYETNAQVTASIAYVYSSGSGIRFDTNNNNFYTSLRPNFYDPGTGTTGSVSNNNWTIQRVYSDPRSGVLYIYYGRNVYPDYQNAIANLSTDSFSEGDTFDFTTFLGFLLLKSNTTDITNTTDNKIIPAGLFRGGGAAGGGGSAVTTLDDLTNVTITSPTNGQALVYNTGVWENGTPISSSYALTASFITPTGTNAFVQGGNSFGTTALLGTNDTQDLQLETSGSARMTINSSGNIGIGTATPSVRLHLSQSSGTFQRVDINNANADGVNATTEYYTNTGATPDLFGATSFRLQGGTTDAFKQFQVYIANLTSPRFIINGSGNVGINTVSPTARLHISGANNGALLIASSSTAPSALFVSGSGNVGIGTATPERRLHADASGSANTDIPLLLTSVDANNRVGIRFASSSLSAGRQHNLYHRVNTATAEWILNSIAGQSAIWNFTPRDDTNYGISLITPFNGGTAQIFTGLSQSLFSLGAGGIGNQYLNISSSGNVGIGTANPAYTLDVNGPFRTNNIAYVGEDFTFTSNQRRFLLEASVDGLVTYTNNTTSVANTTGFLSGEIYLDGSQPYTNHRAINTIVTCRNTSTSNILRGFYASGRTGNSGAASKVTGFTGGVNIEGSGNVTDAIALEIELFSQTNSKTITNLYGLKLGSLINSAGTITNTYGVYIDSLAAGTQTNAAFGLYQAGSDKNYFAGNVGIGETSPSARLEIRGSGATSSTTALRVENSNASASLVVLDNGNVGIGTTTPSASLHVEGNFQISTGSLYTYGQNTDIDSGSIRTVMSVSTGSYRAAFFDYVLNKSTNARAGTVFSVWNGASVEWNDVSTNDIGNTAEVNLSVGLSGANVLLYASSSTNDWSVKALARML